MLGYYFLSQKSIIELMNGLNIFPNSQDENQIRQNVKLRVIGVLNRVQVALCGLKCVNLNNETLKILDVYFWYNKNLEQDKKFLEYIAKTENILKLWHMRSLSLEGRITVFKSLTNCKVIHHY